MLSIRTETSQDHSAVRDLIVEAFTNCEFGYGGEAELLDQLRKNSEDYLSLVATESEQVIGHAMFSPVSIRNSSGDFRGMGLGPMAVALNRQRTGIGTTLVEAGLKQLSHDGYPFVVALGHPQYYPRLGFFPAAKYGVLHAFDGIAQEVFFINILDPNAVHSIVNGIATYRPEFGPQRDNM